MWSITFYIVTCNTSNFRCIDHRTVVPTNNIFFFRQFSSSNTIKRVERTHTDTDMKISLSTIFSFSLTLTRTRSHREIACRSRLLLYVQLFRNFVD